MRRVFKTKTFARWARRVLSDVLLCQAALEIEQGIFETDLGGGLCKKRVATAGRGKSGASRIMVAKKHKQAVFFLAGREKTEPGSDFSDKEVDAVKIVAAGLQKAHAAQLLELLASGILKEICNDREKAKRPEPGFG